MGHCQREIWITSIGPIAGLVLIVSNLSRVDSFDGTRRWVAVTAEGRFVASLAAPDVSSTLDGPIWRVSQTRWAKYGLLSPGPEL
jgi:hypothetical protein